MLHLALFIVPKDINTLSIDINLLYFIVQMADLALCLVRSPVNQTPGQRWVVMGYIYFVTFSWVIFVG